MNNRIENIKRIELDLFRKTHNKSFDAAFTYMNNFLVENYFGNKDFTWNNNKMKEEFGEIEDALCQLQEEIDNRAVTPESLHHLIEEIGDWLLATSTAIEFKEFDMSEYQSSIIAIRHVIEDVNTSLLMNFGEDVITVDSVFESNKVKIEEYAAAFKTYMEVQTDEVITNNPLAKIIKMLHTKKELRDPASRDKIIKEIRRMRFAIIEYKKWGI